MEGLKATLPSERMLTIDILRGFALFGILAMNMIGYASPQLYEEPLRIGYTNHWDQLVYQWMMILLQGKFYALFSFLFGAGFVLFMQRAEQRTKRPYRIFTRRMVILLLLGFLHGVFLWWGDILMTYAVGGLILLMFYQAKPKTLLVWAVILLTVFSVAFSFIYFIAGVAEKHSPGIYSQGMAELYEQYRESAEASYYAYGSGTFHEIMSQRFVDLQLMLENLPVSLFLVIPMFLLGAAAMKLNWFQLAIDHPHGLRTVGLISILLGIGFTWLKEKGRSGMDFLEPGGSDLQHIIGATFGDPALCIAYICIVIWLCNQPRWLRRLRPLAAAGRMSLTHYLGQSLVCTTLFYSYGFGLYGKLGPSTLIWIALSLYIVQVVFSVIWLKRFRYGPLEWIWRKGTYLPRSNKRVL